MEIRKDYAVMFNAVSNTIEELEKIIFQANNCLEILKRAQIEAEEIFMAECENGVEETSNMECHQPNK